MRYLLDCARLGYSVPGTGGGLERQVRLLNIEGSSRIAALQPRVTSKVGTQDRQGLASAYTFDSRTELVKRLSAIADLTDTKGPDHCL